MTRACTLDVVEGSTYVLSYPNNNGPGYTCVAASVHVRTTPPGEGIYCETERPSTPHAPKYKRGERGRTG